MRLTLRTLLAYMDGLLDPKDTQEIGKKVEESKFATELFHKIRDVMRRLRLGAPSISERAANLDCNTVAEYLDNVMPGDRVPDFEEVSLKSEMHLAEVASCHQILTMVLGEPVEIDPNSRQRMYQLPTVANRMDEERLAAAEAATVLSGDGHEPASSAAPPKVRPRPVVPEYLRDPVKKSRLLPTAIVVFFGSAAVGLLLWALGLMNQGTPLGNALVWLEAKVSGKAADNEDRDDATRKKSGKSPEDALAASGSTASSESAGKSSGATLVDGGNEPAASSVAKNSAASPATAQSEVPAVPSQPLTGSAGTTASVAATPGTPASQPSATDPRATVPPAAVLPATVASVPPAVEKKPNAAEKPLESVVGPDLTGAAPKVLPGDAHDSALLPKPAAAVGPGDAALAMKSGTMRLPADKGAVPPSADDKLKLGRFTSDGQDILLKFDGNRSEWRRILPEEFLAGRQPLLALPSYRSHVVVLGAPVELELINGTRIELLPDNAQGQPGLDIDFGRVAIKPLAQAGASLRVVVGSHAGTLTLTSAESIAGLEVTRVHDAGTDPEKILSHAVTRLYAARGGVTWAESDGRPPVRLAAPDMAMLDGAATDTVPGADKEIPKWITANIVNEIDQRAALSVSQSLPDNRPASLTLMELTEDRRREVRWLAARCLGYLGQFDPMTAALNDVNVHSEWHDYIEQLKEAVARGPETAAGIRQSLEKQYHDDSAALYRMLWGYTDKQLEDGEDAQLVKYLDHESPVFRVLAFWSLQDITHKGLYYHPEATAAKRATSVQQWRKEQQLGRIRNAQPDAKPKSGPAGLVPDSGIPKQPKPLGTEPPGAAPPGDANPASATEPSGSAPGLSGNSAPAAGARKPAAADRLPVSVPEPDPGARRSRTVYPEPQAGDGP